MSGHPANEQYVTYENLVRAMEAQTKRFEELFDRAVAAMEKAIERNRYQRDCLMVLIGLAINALWDHLSR